MIFRLLHLRFRRIPGFSLRNGRYAPSSVLIFGITYGCDEFRQLPSLVSYVADQAIPLSETIVAMTAPIECTSFFGCPITDGQIGRMRKVPERVGLDGYTDRQKTYLANCSFRHSEVFWQKRTIGITAIELVGKKNRTAVKTNTFFRAVLVAHGHCSDIPCILGTVV